jgi:hypothetical protein
MIETTGRVTEACKFSRLEDQITILVSIPSVTEEQLTPMRRDFYPIILALRAWGETWCKRPGEPIAVRMTHSDCGTEVGLDGFCPPPLIGELFYNREVVDQAVHKD